MVLKGAWAGLEGGLQGRSRHARIGRSTWWRHLRAVANCEHHHHHRHRPRAAIFASPQPQHSPHHNQTTTNTIREKAATTEAISTAANSTTPISLLISAFHSSGVSDSLTGSTSQPLDVQSTLAASVLSIRTPQPTVIANETSNSTFLHTWWHSTGGINSQTRVQDGNVRQSHLYDVQVQGTSSPSEFYKSFVYETISRNGMGQICSPENPQSYCDIDDQVSIEPTVGTTRAWTQFLSNTDTLVKVTRNDGPEIDTSTRVIIRPTNMIARSSSWMERF